MVVAAGGADAQKGSGWVCECASAGRLVGAGRAGTGGGCQRAGAATGGRFATGGGRGIRCSRGGA
jgi:hypothetical protein